MNLDDVVADGVRATPADWKKALDRVVPCCVVLKVTQTRAIDTEAACSSYATGFIVDKTRGIILTNRHVVTPGPIVAEAIFLNREELPVVPLYYDPVHDFAFLRFDPSKLQFMDVAEVPLAPEAACVGLDIRVVGNDSGEKVSILAGTLARLDRDAPVYGRKGYNDFNTFYLQAASGTKGGSSGSPVIDCQGRAVGLNAGGKNKAASAYYMPLDRVVRALKVVQSCKDLSLPWHQWEKPVICRGDLQTTFVFKGFDEIRRLGLCQETERLIRHSKSWVQGGHVTGALVVDSVVPGSPADGSIEAGDVLVSVNGDVVTHFLTLEDIMDTNVGKKVNLRLERGGKMIEAAIEVTNLHDVTPSSFLELAGGSVHALSYQQARNNRAVVGRVYVAEPGYMLGRANVPKHAIITALNSVATPDLQSFAAVLRGLAHGARVPLEYYTFSERHRRKNAILHVDRQWYGPPIYWTRDDAAGIWHPTTDYPASVPNSIAPAEASATEALTAPVSAEVETSEAEEAESRMRSCLALVDVDIPLVALTDGVHARSFAGNGLVVYLGENLGLVLVDRNTVAVGPCDVNISFGAHPAEVSGKVRFLHPLHNFAIVSFNPQSLPAQARQKVRAAELRPWPPLKRGDSIRLVGLTKYLRIMQRQSIVTNATAALTIPSAEVPRFRAVHEEVIKLDQDFGATFSGVLTDDDGHVRALWGSYAEQVDKEEREWCAGLPTDVFYPWVQKLKLLDQNAPLPPPPVRVLDAELEAVMLSKAAQFGLPADWVSILDKLDAERRQVLRVRSCVAQSHAAKVLRIGDMLLAVADKPVTCFRDVENIAAAIPWPENAECPSETDDLAGRPAKRCKTSEARAAANGQHAEAPSTSGTSEPAAGPSLRLTIYRSGAIQNVDLQLGVDDGLGTSRLLHWCGAQLQAPHRGVRELGYLPDGASGVYISRWHHGSPAHRYGLYALHWIMEVNSVPTPDLDSFVNVVKHLTDGVFVRVKVVHLETTQPKVLTLKMDLKYWPTWELRLDPHTCNWDRIQISPPHS